VGIERTMLIRSDNIRERKREGAAKLGTLERFRSQGAGKPSRRWLTPPAPANLLLRP
jgi:hypothetical protein